MSDLTENEIIAGGMGVGVSDPGLVRAISSWKNENGERCALGTLSLTAPDYKVTRQLQKGDILLRETLENFPVPEVAEKIIRKYYVEGGIEPGQGYKPFPMSNLEPSTEWLELQVASSYVLVKLAKTGHGGPVAVNSLEKLLQVVHAPTIFGAMLAGVNIIAMGAGIPRQIPKLIDDILGGNVTEYKIDVKGLKDGFVSRIDLRKMFDGKVPEMERPAFIPIISSHVLAKRLANTQRGKIDGFIVEGFSAGGHNAPPSIGEVDLEVMRGIGLPFWLAGSYCHPEKLAEAKEHGAAGVQLGTAFAFCGESGMDPKLREQVIRKFLDGSLEVETMYNISPTKFPFKVLKMEGTLSDPQILHDRNRTCDKGCLRVLVKGDDDKIKLYCPAQPGGEAGYGCLCNALMATAGIGDVGEVPIITSGMDFGFLTEILKPGETSYSAHDVLEFMLG